MAGLNRPAIGSYSWDVREPPTFIARKNPGTGWGVDILWPDGETEVIKGFITEHDAAKWIAELSTLRRGWEIQMIKPPNRPRESTQLAKLIC